MIRNNFMFANACKIKRHVEAHFLYLAAMVFWNKLFAGNFVITVHTFQRFVSVGVALRILFPSFRRKKPMDSLPGVPYIIPYVFVTGECLPLDENEKTVASP